MLTFKTCRIKIDLRFGRGDESSWLAINLALDRVLHACRLTHSGERTGGQTTAGNADLIVITAENVKWPAANLASARSVDRLRP